MIHWSWEVAVVAGVIAYRVTVNEGLNCFALLVYKDYNEGYK